MAVRTLLIMVAGHLLKGDAATGQIIWIAMRVLGLAHTLRSVIAPLAVSIWSTLSDLTDISAQAESLWSHDADFILLADRQIVDTLVTFTAMHDVIGIAHRERWQTFAGGFPFLHCTKCIWTTCVDTTGVRFANILVTDEVWGATFSVIIAATILTGTFGDLWS